MTENPFQEIINKIEEMKKEDIEILLYKTVNFLEKFEILFYTKKDNIIKGYLEIRNRNFYFEIRINKLKNEEDYTVSITIGKIVIVKKVEVLI